MVTEAVVDSDMFVDVHESTLTYASSMRLCVHDVAGVASSILHVPPPQHVLYVCARRAGIVWWQVGFRVCAMRSACTESAQLDVGE